MAPGASAGCPDRVTLVRGTGASCMGFFAELKRRNVIRVAVAYLVFSWLVLQVLDVVTPFLDLPRGGTRTVFVLRALGFVCALVFSWVYELTPEGL